MSWQQRRQPSTQSRNGRNQTQTTTALGTRTSTSSAGSTFSLEVTFPEGNGSTGGEARSKTPSRLRRPSSSHASLMVLVAVVGEILLGLRHLTIDLPG